MLHVIQTPSDPLAKLSADDPVRPEIPLEFRIGEHSEIFVLCDDESHEAQAVVCCAYRDFMPANIEELAQLPLNPGVAVFYTIWSYKPGAGRKLIIEARRWIEVNRRAIKEFVTLSPPTDMARVFHLRNGASVGRVNPGSVNYRYP